MTKLTAASQAVRAVFSRRHIRTQILGLGLSWGVACSAFGQIQNGGFGSFGGTLTQPGQVGTTGQTSGLGGLTGGLGQTGGLGGGLGTTGQAGAQSGPGIQLGANNMANAFGSGGILGTNTSSAFGGLANTALLGRSLNGAGGQNGLGGMGGMNGMNGGRGGQGGRNNFNNMNQNQNNNKTQVRATVKLGFDYVAPTSAAGAQVINSRLSRIPSPLLKGVNVEMNGRTAIVRGKVDTLAEANVIERYLSLEPGISAVKNELTIASGEKIPAKAAKKSPTARRSSSQSNTDSTSDSTVQVAPEVVPAPGPQ